MGGRQPKNSQWFETGVAAFLQTQRLQDPPLDLTSFHIDPNPPYYLSDATGVGYNGTVDITAQKGNIKINVSCKFSESENSILNTGSKQAAEVFLEFVPALLSEKPSGFRMGFLLATNIRFGTSLRSLLSEPSRTELREFVNKVRTVGAVNYGEKFRRRFFSAQRIQYIAHKLMPLQITIRELEKFYQDDTAFAKAQDRFSHEILRRPTSIPVFPVGIALPDVTMGCDSRNHSQCRDWLFEDLSCHIGNIGFLFTSIMDKVEVMEKNHRTVETLSILTPTGDVSLLNTQLSDARACLIISKVLTANLALPLRFGIYLVPGSFDVIILDTASLAVMIRDTEVSDPMFRYRPDRVPELVNLHLGPDSLKELAKFVLQKGLGLSVSDKEVVVQESDA